MKSPTSSMQSNSGQGRTHFVSSFAVAVQLQGLLVPLLGGGSTAGRSGACPVPTIGAMRIVLVGPGRAGMSLAIAATAANHEVVAVVGRSFDSAERGAALVNSTALTLASELPPADLLMLATRDAVIGAIATQLATKVPDIEGAVHLSGLTPVGALAPLAAAGIMTGSFHPLQTLPTPETGAARLAGSHIAITADPPLRQRLESLAVDLGAIPFPLADEAKPL